MYDEDGQMTRGFDEAYVRIHEAQWFDGFTAIVSSHHRGNGAMECTAATGLHNIQTK